MKKYIKLLISNLIAITVYVLISLYFRSIEQSAGLGAVVFGLWILAFFGIYLIGYGIVSCKMTNSVVLPNLMVFILLLVSTVLPSIYNFADFLDRLFAVLFALSFSLIPSLLTKLIMLIANKCDKAKQADDTAAITKG